MKTSIFLKQQLKYEEVRAKSKNDTKSSAYKRFSAHLTLEMPDLSDVVRETSSRMESMIANGRNEQSNVGELQRSHTTLH